MDGLRRPGVWLHRSKPQTPTRCCQHLLDVAKSDGFAFERIALGPAGPLLGARETVQWRDEVYLGGFWAPSACSATRRRRSSLVVPGGLPVAECVSGDALTVLRTVLCDWTA